MKLSMNTDFTKMPRAGSVIRAADLGPDRIIPFDLAVLDHEERHLRRRVIQLVHGDRILVDLPDAIQLDNHDVLVLDDGRHAEIIASEEHVYDIRARDAVHLAEIAWHIGNRHLAAQIEEHRILILRDHVIKAMLEGLGAKVTEESEPFHPVRGAYSGHSHGHGPQPDDHGRLPGDPHYGHNHGPGEHHDHDHGHHHGHHGHEAHAHGHDHDHEHHGHGHDHGHGHGEPDRFGRMPGDPHYGHNHG